MAGSLVSPLKAYITRLERRYFDPALASYEVVHRLNNAIAKVYEKAKKQSYDLSQILLIEEEVNKQVDRFWAWTKRKVVNVKEACKIFNRSRSTIYRWIKQGKFANAIKVKGKWRIAL